MPFFMSAWGGSIANEYILVASAGITGIVKVSKIPVMLSSDFGRLIPFIQIVDRC